VDAVGVIPARWASTRFPGKPLALIAGKPLLQWVIEGARTSRKLKQIVVATDDERIAALAEKCGVKPIMTASDLPTGTDRVYQAALQTGGDVIVNIQGDEPLIEGSLLDSLVAPFDSEPGMQMATLGKALSPEGLASANIVKIVLNRRDEALYFSRFPIPYSRVPAGDRIEGALQHIGIYAYRMEFLKSFCSQEPTHLEQSESLEQLRALYLGARIKVVRVEHDSWGVDTPEDVQKIERILAQRGEGAKT
jgi:3-deoxy-manno-octulosonate cytidylyltransferase (CMP-KDO synthetase)